MEKLRFWVLMRGVFGVLLAFGLMVEVQGQLVGGGGAGAGVGGSSALIGRGGAYQGPLGPSPTSGLMPGRTGLIQRYGPGEYSTRGGRLDQLRSEAAYSREREILRNRYGNNPYHFRGYGAGGSYANADYVPAGARVLGEYGPYRFNLLPINPAFPPWGHLYDFRQAAVAAGFYALYRSPLYTYLWRFGRQPFPQELGVSPSLPYRPEPYQPKQLEEFKRSKQTNVEGLENY